MTFNFCLGWSGSGKRHQKLCLSISMVCWMKLKEWPHSALAWSWHEQWVIQKNEHQLSGSDSSWQRWSDSVFCRFSGWTTAPFCLLWCSTWRGVFCLQIRAPEKASCLIGSVQNSLITGTTHAFPLTSFKVSDGDASDSQFLFSLALSPSLTFSPPLFLQ